MVLFCRLHTYQTFSHYSPSVPQCLLQHSAPAAARAWRHQTWWRHHYQKSKALSNYSTWAYSAINNRLSYRLAELVTCTKTFNDKSLQSAVLRCRSVCSSTALAAARAWRHQSRDASRGVSRAMTSSLSAACGAARRCERGWRCSCGFDWGSGIMENTIDWNKLQNGTGICYFIGLTYACSTYRWRRKNNRFLYERTWKI